MAIKKKNKGNSPLKEIRNRKAFRDYFIEERFEAGIALKGTEIKSIRLGKAQLDSAFVRIEKDNAILYHAHIDEYAFGNVHNHNPLRPRQLLLHKREINKLRSAMETKGMAIIPTKMYFKKALVKVEVALCKGKQAYDKRHDLKKQAMMRDVERELSRWRR